MRAWGGSYLLSTPSCRGFSQRLGEDRVACNARAPLLLLLCLSRLSLFPLLTL